LNSVIDDGVLRIMHREYRKWQEKINGNISNIQKMWFVVHVQSGKNKDQNLCKFG